MLRYFIRQVHRRRYFAKPRMVICVPSGITGRRAAGRQGGGLPGRRPPGLHHRGADGRRDRRRPAGPRATGNMVVDVGGGTTEVAVISLGGIVTSLSVRTAGDDLDAAIVAWMKKEHAPDARRAHRRGGQDDRRLGLPAAPGDRGRDPRPRHGHRAAAHRRPSPAPRSARRSRSRCTPSSTPSAPPSTRRPPELAGDIMDRGIVLTGGGALLRGLDERLRHETGMPVHVADDPLTCVAMGAAKCVEEFEALQQVLVAERLPTTEVVMPPRRPGEPRPRRSVLVALLLACVTLITLDSTAAPARPSTRPGARWARCSAPSRSPCRPRSARSPPSRLVPLALEAAGPDRHLQAENSDLRQRVTTPDSTATGSTSTTA